MCTFMNDQKMIMDIILQKNMYVIIPRICSLRDEYR